MKPFVAAALAAGLAQQAVASEWGQHDLRYITPALADNSHCHEKQRSGYRWDDLEPGDFHEYDGLQFDRFKCRDATLPDYPDYHRSIYSNLRKDYDDSPRVLWNDKGFSPNRYLVQPVDYDKDIEIEFHYERHDGTKCKHISPCGPGGTYISNTQCGDAKTVTVKLPDHVDIDELEVNIYGIDFDCEPAIAYEFPQDPRGDHGFQDGTHYDDKNYHTDDYNYEDDAHYDDKNYHSDDYDFEDGTRHHDTDYDSDDYQYEDGKKHHDTDYDSDDYYYEDGKKYNKDHHDDGYDFQDGKNHDGVYTPVEHHKGHPDPTYHPQPIHPDDCKDDCEPFDPKFNIDCPEILPRCFNSWLPQTGCKDNTDINCFCGLHDFIDNVAGCIGAHEEMYDRSNDAYTYMAGICVEFIPKNPTIVAVCPPEVKIAPPPPEVKVKYPDNLEWKPHTIDTVVTKYPEVYEAKHHEVAEHPQTYSTYKLQTTVTVPQVVFQSPEPAKFDAPRQVYLAPGTPPPAKPYVPEHPPASYPAPHPAPHPSPAPVAHPAPVAAPHPTPAPAAPHPEPYHPEPVHPEPIHPDPVHPEPVHPEPHPVDDWEPASTVSAVDSFDTSTYDPAPTDEPKSTGVKYEGSASRLGLGSLSILAVGLVALAMA